MSVRTIASAPKTPESLVCPTELLTVREAAKALRVHEKTIYNLRHRGELPSAKFGVHKNAPVRIRRSDLEQYVARHCRISSCEIAK